jgi:hypothetical protein
LNPIKLLPSGSAQSRGTMNDSDTSSSVDGDDQIYHHDGDDDDDEGRYVPRGSERKRLDLLKLVSVLERKFTYPARTIEKIDDLVVDFLENLEDDVHQMLCSNDGHADYYQGLDSNIDTEAEVEAIIRIFPNVLSKSKHIMWTDEDADHEEVALWLYRPIQLLAFTIHEDESLRINLKAVPFIPVVARLAIEFGSDYSRGGLLRHDIHSNTNVLQSLMVSDFTEIHNRDHHEHIDDMYLQVLINLRQIGLLKKEDIQRHDLLNIICRFFAEKRFRFLVQWDPTALTQTNENRCIPLHFAAMQSIQVFWVVFEYGIRYYPKKKGICLLFKKDDDDDTPFQLACEKFGYKEVMKVVEDTLLDCQRRRQRLEEDLDDSNTSGSYNTVDAIVTAAIDENIHLDCVHFLIRREPDVLQKLLLSKQTVEAATTVKLDSSSSSNSSNSNSSNSNSEYDSKQRKRKR